jgi:hypothetical protein
VTERGAVRRLGGEPQRLVHERVSHLVLEHLDHHAPALLEHERPRDLDSAANAVPATEVSARERELDHRRREAIGEEAGVEALPLLQELANERRLELGRQGRHFGGVHGARICASRAAIRQGEAWANRPLCAF